MPDGSIVNIKALWELIHDASLAAILFGIIVTGYYKIWVWGKDYDKKERECDEWKRIVFELKGVLRESLSMPPILPPKV